MNAFPRLGLKVFKADREVGYVEGGRRPGFARGAENVGVFVESMGPEKTAVSIDNRKHWWGSAFAKNWTSQVFQEIDRQLLGQ